MFTLPTLVRVILVLTFWFTLAEKVKLVLGRNDDCGSGDAAQKGDGSEWLGWRHR